MLTDPPKILAKRLWHGAAQPHIATGASDARGYALCACLGGRGLCHAPSLGERCLRRVPIRVGARG